MERGPYVVIWRREAGDAWQVQPHIHDDRSGRALGRKLTAQYGGETWLAPIELPAEDTSELRR